MGKDGHVVRRKFSFFGLRVARSVRCMRLKIETDGRK